MSINGMNDLEDRLRGAINYIRLEYDLTYAEFIGVIEIIKQDMYYETITVDDNDDEIDDEQES